MGAQTEAAAREPAATQRRDRARFIICDDAPDVRDLLKKAIAMYGDMPVAGEAADGREAIEQTSRLQPDVVVLDLSMPVMSGMDALPLILAAAPETTVVVMSGREEHETDALQLGASAYILKGTALDEIVSVLRRIAGLPSRPYPSAPANHDAADHPAVEAETRALRDELEERVARRTADLERRTAELQESMAELDAFAYSVSHDLRAPLRALDGFSRILLEDLGDSLDAEHAEHLTFIRSNAQGMQRLIDGLLSFSRLGRRGLEPVEVAPVVLVRQALSDLGPVAEGSRASVSVGDLPACVADPTLLKQVFVNLLDNALKFTKEVSDPRVEVGACTVGDQTAYFVKDNGVGFDPLYAEKVFGVFQRLHVAERFEGSGIGLANAERIVQKHRGRIWCESGVEAGAAFYFTVGTEAS